MNSSFRFVLLLSFCIVTIGYLSGCGSESKPGKKGDTDAPVAKGDQPDPHDVPITPEQEATLKKELAKYPDLVKKIKELRDVVQEETKDGTPACPFAVHQALDKLDIITQWAPAIASKSVPKEQWEVVATASSSLREAFDKIHLNIDDKKDPDFASVEKEIDAKIAELQALVK